MYLSVVSRALLVAIMEQSPRVAVMESFLARSLACVLERPRWVRLVMVSYGMAPRAPMTMGRVPLGLELRWSSVCCCVSVEGRAVHLEFAWICWSRSSYEALVVFVTFSRFPWVSEAILMSQRIMSP